MLERILIISLKYYEQHCITHSYHCALEMTNIQHSNTNARTQIRKRSWLGLRCVSNSRQSFRYLREKMPCNWKFVSITFGEHLRSDIWVSESSCYNRNYLNAWRELSWTSSIRVKLRWRSFRLDECVAFLVSTSGRHATGLNPQQLMSDFVTKRMLLPSSQWSQSSTRTIRRDTSVS